MNKIIAVLVLISIHTLSPAQNREKAYRINKELGHGINFGNMLEAPYEGAWGTMWQPEYARMIAGLGFDHIRIPVCWEQEERSMPDPPYTIYPDFLKRVKEVVDSVLNSGLYAIINMHHHTELSADPYGQRDRFLSQWKQISDYFKDYSDSLLFEILNEPANNITVDIWNELAADAIDTIRVKNPDRIILFDLGVWGREDYGLPDIILPDDDNLILTVHFYNPFYFTHQGASWVEGSDEWLGSTWYNTESERQLIKDALERFVVYEQEKNIPIHMGEFGSLNTADSTSRRKWTTFVARYADSLNWSWAYWEFCAGFGIYDPETGEYDQQLVDALLHNKMPLADKYPETVIYSSDLENSDDGWTLYASGNAAANMDRTNSTFNITIEQAGTENWHIQLIKPGIKLEHGKKYKLSLEAKADSERVISADLGLNESPWISYMNYNTACTITDTFKTYEFVFDMLKPTDEKARIVIAMGQSDIDVSVRNISLVTLDNDSSNAVKKIKTVSTRIFPNPASTFVYIDNLDNFKTYDVLTIEGHILSEGKLEPSINSVDIKSLTKGIYFLRLKNNNRYFTFKLLKK